VEGFEGSKATLSLHPPRRVAVRVIRLVGDGLAPALRLLELAVVLLARKRLGGASLGLFLEAPREHLGE
jgi:hypothetical protein